MCSVKIVEATESPEHELYLYKCLAPLPKRIYSPRREYLEGAIPKGLRKRLLIAHGEVVGQVEYAPAEAAGYPIIGHDIIVMNCIWVLRRAGGNGFGRMLLEEMRKSEPRVFGFTTISLENHWSPWLKKEHLEWLGFRPIDGITVRHKTKHPDRIFRIWLMWRPERRWAFPPAWDKEALLEGVTFCYAHPLSRPKTVSQSPLELCENGGLLPRKQEVSF